MTITIESMNLLSVDEVLEISKLSLSETWSKDSFIRELENPLSHYLIAKKDNKIVGFIGFWIVVGEATINNIAIHPNYRGNGISNILMDSMLDVCKSQNTFAITLEVRSSNTTAQNLYKKYGFVEEGIRKNYYSDNGEDAIIMWKHNL